jgi:hypothetical protein
MITDKLASHGAAKGVSALKPVFWKIIGGGKYYNQ